MKIVFMHQNFPGQYKHLARMFGADGRNEVYFITKPKAIDIPGVKKLTYKLHREAQKTTHHYITPLESAVLFGQAAARALVGLKKTGFTPDVICAHPGWGESLYVKDVYPSVPLLNYFEFYYRSSGSDVGFDPEIEVSLNDNCRIRTKNTNNLLSLEGCDAGVSPTRWQRKQFPKEFLYKISLIHDGIDTEATAPDKEARLDLPNGKVLTRNDEVVTYVARNLEPYRGFPVFMRAVEEICRRRPHAQIVIVGGDGVSYGRRLPKGETYRAKALSEVKIDAARVHFLGYIPYERYLKVLKVSSAHVYLTYPFVLSWSMLEAMSAGCLIVGSDTPPVTEVLAEGKNGLLVDFFSPKQIADRVDEVLDHKDRFAILRRHARETILERYELNNCLKKHVKLIKSLADGKLPTMAKTIKIPA
ncbi:MAG TPA: glycosyltransferase family 4 protein [Alphaproteobacteria bacterium]|jgi:glycosyltransferase involved in cell wall biosynthesis|nr:glycosyltransferase family 4 protein [Alphaproteobacteria bacterium]